MKDILYFNTLEDIKIVDMIRTTNKKKKTAPEIYGDKIELKESHDIYNYNYVVGYNEGGDYLQYFINNLNLRPGDILDMYLTYPILLLNKEVYTFYFKCIDNDKVIIKLTITDTSILVDDKEMSAENVLLYINLKISLLGGKKYLWKWDNEYMSYLVNQVGIYGMAYTEWESSYADICTLLQSYLFAYVLKPTVITTTTLDTLMTLNGGEEGEEGEESEEGEGTPMPMYTFKNSFNWAYVLDIRFIENPNNINSTSWDVYTSKWGITKNNNIISVTIGEEASTDLNYIMNDFLNDAGKNFIWLTATNNQTNEDLFSSFAPMILVTYLSYNE